MNLINLVISDSMKSVVRSLGVESFSDDSPSCPFVVGDLLTLPEAAGMTFVVTKRMFSPERQGHPARWYLWVEPTENPLHD